MKQIVVALTGLALLFSARHPAPAEELTAQQILGKVGETCRQLHDYQIEAVQHDLKSVAGQGVAMSEARFTLAIAAPDKVRLNFKNSRLDLLIVSDGQTTWWYLPERKAYTRVSAAATLPLGGEGADTRRDWIAQVEQILVGRYTGLTMLGSGAVLKRQDDLKVGGKKTLCYVVEVHQGDTTHKLWIDAERFLVLRDEEHSKSLKNGVLTGHEIRTDVKQAQIGTPSESLFTFAPPPDARQVEMLGIPGEHVNLTGMSAKDFSLKDAQGTKFSLSDFRGKVVLLDFWATWCPPCLEELPRINALYRQHKDRDLVVLGVGDEDTGTIRDFLKKSGYELPTLVDSDRTVHKLYGVQVIPTLVIINRQGVVVADYVGRRTEQEVLAALKAAGVSN
jgi:peroxiredoxin/outer membrane lipoprotein-sorting protein